jgi:CheY-like chemotaxis protein
MHVPARETDLGRSWDILERWSKFSEVCQGDLGESYPRGFFGALSRMRIFSVTRHRLTRWVVPPVIHDLTMPVMGGTECFRELLMFEPHAKVLVADDHWKDGSVKETIPIHRRGLVTKPFRVKELLLAVSKAVDEN